MAHRPRRPPSPGPRRGAAEDGDRPPVRIGRRQLVKAVAVVALAAGCGVTKRPAAGPDHSAPTDAGAATTGSAAPDRGPTATEWRRLAASLAGPLVRPGQDDYTTDRQLYDFRYDSVRPAGIAYCATADDVARCLAFARAHGVVPTPRAGGHSYAGYSTSSGLVVDVTRMAAIGLPRRDSTTATVGAGARLIDVYTTLNAAGVSIPAGSCPTVGITGLTLGGGIGVVCRRYGLTSDSVVSARIVTADSRVVTASAETNPDLYWACRGGGGGNFGVVTSWEMKTFPTTPVVFFTLTWAASAADQVLPAWQDWVQATPDEMWSNCLLLAQPSQAQALLQVGGVYLGTKSGAAGLIAKLIAVAGTPLSYFIESVPFGHAMYVEANCAQLTQSACHLPTQAPGGQLARSPSLAKSELLTTPLADAGVAAVIDAVASGQRSGLPGAVAFDALGGATARPAAGATAWVHRDARFSVQYSVPLAPTDSPAVLAAYRGWLDGLYHALRPHVSGQSYQNYIDPDLPDWKHAYYGANLSRLEQARKKWDPDALFRFAQAMPVA